MERDQLAKVYAAKSSEEQRAAYDDWAHKYEPDLCAAGYRLPAMIGSVFARFVAIDTAPILDAGCGGGIQAEALHAVGYRDLVGIDLSPGMLEVAKAKQIYASLHEAKLGDRLSFDDEQFGAILSSGTITPGHAPPETFDELIRVTKNKGLVIFSLRSDAGQEQAYFDILDKLEADKRWIHKFSTPAFCTMPYTEPNVQNKIHVYKVTHAQST